MAKDGGAADPLRNPRFQEPSVWQLFRESLFGKPRLLDCIQVEVTSVCPGRCVYCPHTTQAGYWRSRHMEAETFARLWPLMRESGRVHLQGWGEPFLHPRFMDFAALARKAGCRVSTTTCGLRMDETLAGQIVGSGIDIVAFSLVGTDEASNAPRAGVPFSRVREAVRTLQRVRKAKMGVHLELHFAYLMLASQMEAVEGLPDLMDELDVHAAVISTLDYIAAPGLEAEAFSPHEAGKLDAARDILERVAEETAKRGRGLYYSLPSPRPDDGCGLFPCRENAARTLYVDAEGRMSPCIYLNLPVDAPASSPEAVNRRVFGSAVEEDPLGIWQSGPFRMFRDALQSPLPDIPCRTCPKRFETGN